MSLHHDSDEYETDCSSSDNKLQTCPNGQIVDIKSKIIIQVYWGEKTKINAQLLCVNNTSLFISFAISYLIKIGLIYKAYSFDYYWSLTKFNLHIHPKSSSWSNISLIGSLEYCCRSDDLFFRILGFLKELSRKIPELIIKISEVDSFNNRDDSLALISGRYLPPWVQNQHIAENRIFLSGGEFHFISRELVTSKHKVKIDDAIAAVSSPITNTIMNKKAYSHIESMMLRHNKELDLLSTHQVALHPLYLSKLIFSIFAKFPELIKSSSYALYAHSKSFTLKDYATITDAFPLLVDKKVLKNRVPLTKKCYSLLSLAPLAPFVEQVCTDLGSKLSMGFFVLLAFIRNKKNKNDIPEKVIHSALEVFRPSESLNEKSCKEILANISTPVLYSYEFFAKELQDLSASLSTLQRPTWDQTFLVSNDTTWDLSYEEMLDYIEGTFEGTNDIEDDFFLSEYESDLNSDSLGELEVYDTLVSDPDLLMKLMEKYSQAEEPTTDLVKKLAQFKFDHYPSNKEKQVLEVPLSESSTTNSESLEGSSIGYSTEYTSLDSDA